MCSSDLTTGVSLTEDQVEKYRMRLHKQERDRLVEMSQRGPGGIGNLGAGYLGDSNVTRGGGGDLRTGILEGMNAIRNVTTNLFGPRDGQSDILGAPPETIMPRPPAVEAPWQGTKPDGTPKDVVELTPEVPSVYDRPDTSYYPKPPPPKLSPLDPRNTPKSGKLEY